MAAFTSVVSLVIFSLFITFTHQFSLRQDQEIPPTEQSAYRVHECGEHEIWSWCLAHCQRNCSNYDAILICRRICVPGCVCERDYVRGEDEKCVSINTCPPQSEEEPSRVEPADPDPECPSQETWSWCQAHCERNCTDYNKIKSCPRYCVPGCVCEEGLVRSADGKCIEPSSCPLRSEEVQTRTYWSEWASSEDPECPENEDWSWCLAHCQKNCTNYNDALRCRKICVPGCVCKKDFVRGPGDKCIPVNSCPSQSEKVPTRTWKTDRDCPEHEHSDWCYAHCQKDCTNYDKPMFCPQICISGCVCDEGYVRGRDGSCVLISSCPAEKAKRFQSMRADKDCPVNEHSDWCYAHCQRDCTNYDKDIPCQQICVPGCVCDEGYVRGHDGSCTPISSCPARLEEETDPEERCPVNEHYSRCDGYPECQKNCSNYDKRIVCPMICYPGCVCDEGYVRGPDGKCVQISRCPVSNDLFSIQEGSRKCSEYEEFSSCDAHPACQRQCSDGDKPIICPQMCYPGCVCQEGYVRGRDGRCVNISECPSDMSLVEESSVHCAENEEFSLCGAFPSCQRQCSNYDKPITCPVMCFSGCVCKEGYVRGSDGKCVEVSECPEKMDTFGDLLPIPVICRRDEVFSVCVSSCPDDCDNYEDRARKCNLICLPGCTCKKGTIRGPDGRCIKPDLCPTNKKPEDCTELEYYDTCGTNCPDDCKNYASYDRPCDKRCVVGCFCLPGYVRGPRGDCIFSFECPTVHRPQVYTSSPEKMTASHRYSASPENTYSSRMYTSSPQKMSRSQDYSTSPEDKVYTNLPRKSEPIECPSLEHYSECGANPMCQRNCTNYQEEYLACPLMCVEGCVCDEGLVRKSFPDGPCIRPESCSLSSMTQQNKELFQAQFREGCPDEEACANECIRRGRRYGVCIGARNRDCMCF